MLLGEGEGREFEAHGPSMDRAALRPGQAPQPPVTHNADQKTLTRTR